MLIHALPKSSSPQDALRSDATRVNSLGTPCLVRLDRVFACSLRACAMARQLFRSVGVRSVGITSCFAVGTLTALFFGVSPQRARRRALPMNPMLQECRVRLQ